MESDIDKLLKLWEVDPSEPVPSLKFRQRVWRKIGMHCHRQISPPERLFTMIGTSKIAIFVLILFTLLGGIAGHIIVSKGSPAAYLRSVNPYTVME